MRSSFKIIKSENAAYSDSLVSVSNIKLNIPLENKDMNEDILVEEEIESTEDSQEILSIEEVQAFKEELEKNLRLDIEQERQAILEKALNEAKAEIEKMKEEALNEGYQKGYEHGLQKGIEEGMNQGLKKAFEEVQEECNEIKKRALNLLEQAEKQVKEYYIDSKNRIIDLAGDMAESIVHNAIETSSENIVPLIKPIIQLYEDTETIIITCHPNNVEFLKDNVRELEKVCPKARFIILEDGNLEKNGCVIENESQIIDLQIRKQIDSIIDDIRNMEE